MNELRTDAIDPKTLKGLSPIQIAIHLIGKGEATGKNDGPFVEQVMGDKTKGAWCSAFVMRCFQWAGKKLPVNFWVCREVAKLQEVAQHAGWLVDANYPLRGDIIFFKSRVGSDAGSGNHVGLVEMVKGPFIHTVEGNTGDCVTRRTHAIGSAKIWCIARVPQ